MNYVSALPSAPNSTSTPTSPITLSEFFTTLLNIFAAYKKQDRVTIPTLEVLNLLFESGAVERLITECDEGVGVVERMFELTKAEVSKSKDVRKVGVGIKV